MFEAISGAFTAHAIPVLAVVLALLSVAFIYWFVVRGLALWAGLQGLRKRLFALESVPTTALKSDLHTLFSNSRLQHQWTEYEETLHEQYGFEGGERRLTHVRSTVPAEAFFNTALVVDSRLHVEFFKHLPGVLTGIGIIGTFAGLIGGLVQFDPSADPEALKLSLGGLFGHVQHAFGFSAVAIGLAMVVTLFEKAIYTGCAKNLGELAQHLDGLFQAGVGEEYLSSLVQASQESATQTRQMKESLVEDLKSLLTNLTERQIQATQQLSMDLGKQIETSLREPLSEIAENVRAAGEVHTNQAGTALESLMSAFMAQMRESLGGQLGDLSGLMQQTAQSMVQVESTLRSLVEDMQRVGAESNSALQGTVLDLVATLKQAQAEQATGLSSAAADVLESMRTTMAELSAAQQAASARTESSVANLVGTLESRVQALASANEQTQEGTQRVIESLGQASATTIESLQQGAHAVANAVANISQAAERMGAVAQQLTQLEGQAVKTAQTVTQSATTLGSASQAVANAMGAMSNTSSRLENVAKMATTEVEMREAMLRDIGVLTGDARAASEQFSALAEEVRNTLSGAMDQFGTGVTNVVSKHLADYQKQLADAVSMLKSALEELAEVAAERA